MTAKQYVKNVYPFATIEKQIEGRVKGLQKPYYIVRTKFNASGYIATGNTQSNAWTNAKKFIMNHRE